MGIFVGSLIFNAVELDGSDVAAGLVDSEYETCAGIDDVGAAAAGDAESGGSAHGEKETEG